MTPPADDSSPRSSQRGLSPVPGCNALMDALPWATPRRVNAVLGALRDAGYTLLFMPRDDPDDMPPGSLDYDEDDADASDQQFEGSPDADWCGEPCSMRIDHDGPCR